VRHAGVDGETQNNYLIVNSLSLSLRLAHLQRRTADRRLNHGALAAELGSRFVFERGYAASD
jgi:hypothetical protein